HDNVHVALVKRCADPRAPGRPRLPCAVVRCRAPPWRWPPSPPPAITRRTPMPNKPRFVALTQRVRQLHPHLDDPARSIADGLVRVGGVAVTNPRARVRRSAAVTLTPPPVPPRGARKLAAALEQFAIPVAGRTALDVGASTGGGPPGPLGPPAAPPSPLAPLAPP